VIADKGDLFGDGVNIAARLEGLSEPGGIAISRTVHDRIRDRLPVVFADAGEHEVKNIARPVSVFALSAEAVGKLDAEVPAVPSIRRVGDQIRVTAQRPPDRPVIRSAGAKWCRRAGYGGFVASGS
jgi:adenylate cyclase